MEQGMRWHELASDGVLMPEGESIESEIDNQIS